MLVRHGQSTDNELNLFSGWRDPELTARGVEEAGRAGRRLKGQGFNFNVAFTSKLSRASRTLGLMLDAAEQPELPIVSSEALNERHYGELSGLNKEEARSVWGREQVRLWRKSYDAVPPGGESLAMTAARTMPFYRQAIYPRLRNGEHVLVVAHGNSLRSIIKHLDGLSDDEIVDANIATGEMLLYEIDADGNVGRKTSVSAAVQT